MNDKKSLKIDFIGVGVERCATSWIFECLREHPEICVSKYKEVDFFKDDEKYNRGLDFYSSFFNHCSGEKIVGEFSPWYFFAEKAPERIKKDFPDVKLIISFRNPIEKTYSLYNMKDSYKSLPHKSFEEFIGDKEYVRRAFYAERLKLFYKLFPRENILVLIYEDIKKDPLVYIQNVYRFLGADSNYAPRIISRVHNSPETRGFFRKNLTYILSKFRRSFLMKNKRGREIVHFIEKTGFYGSLESFLATGTKKKNRLAMKKETRKYLQNLFNDDIKEFEKLINRNLSFWK